MNTRVYEFNILRIFNKIIWYRYLYTTLHGIDYNYTTVRFNWNYDTDYDFEMIKIVWKRNKKEYFSIIYLYHFEGVKLNLWSHL